MTKNQDMTLKNMKTRISSCEHSIGIVTSFKTIAKYCMRRSLDWV